MPQTPPQSLRKILAQLAPDATGDDLDEAEVNLKQYVRVMYMAYEQHQRNESRASHGEA